MKHSYILDDEDIVLPTDYMRPLNRAADVECFSSEWCPTNTYGGGPMDTMLWYPVWLGFGQHLWGTKKVSECQTFGKFEFLRGTPSASSAYPIRCRYATRHPLFHKYIESISYKDTNISPVNTHKGKTLAEAFRPRSSSECMWYMRVYCEKQNDVPLWLWLHKHCGCSNMWYRESSDAPRFEHLSGLNIDSPDVQKIFSVITVEMLNETYIK